LGKGCSAKRERCRDSKKLSEACQFHVGAWVAGVQTTIRRRVKTPLGLVMLCKHKGLKMRIQLLPINITILQFIKKCFAIGG
jgi:hypothetical protein